MLGAVAACTTSTQAQEPIVSTCRPGASISQTTENGSGRGFAVDQTDEQVETDIAGRPHEGCPPSQHETVGLIEQLAKRPANKPSRPLTGWNTPAIEMP